MANYVKLIALGTAVATVGAITIGTFASQDTEIKQAVDNLKEMGLQWKQDFNAKSQELTEAQGKLTTATTERDNFKAQLEAIYKKISGASTIPEDLDLASYNFAQDIDALKSGSSDSAKQTVYNQLATTLKLSGKENYTQDDIVNGITELQSTVTALNGRITALEAEINDYKAEEQSLITEINGLKTKLETANEQITKASSEEAGQLAYINQAIKDLGGTTNGGNKGNEGDSLGGSEPEIIPGESTPEQPTKPTKPVDPPAGSEKTAEEQLTEKLTAKKFNTLKTSLTRLANDGCRNAQIFTINDGTELLGFENNPSGNKAIAYKNKDTGNWNFRSDNIDLSGTIDEATVQLIANYFNNELVSQ